MKLFLKELSGREKRLFYGCVALVTTTLLYFLGDEFLLKDWSQINKNVILTEKKIAKCLRILKEEETIKAKQAKYVQKNVSSNETEVAHVLKDVEMIAKENNVKTTNITAKPIKELEFYKEILVNVESEATMQELTKFIYALQQTPKNLRVTSLKITTNSPYATTLTISMMISRILVS